MCKGQLIRKTLWSLSFLLGASVCTVAAAQDEVTTDTSKSNDNVLIAKRDITGFAAVDEKLPLWEYGVGGGYGQAPNYPSSSETNKFGIALPYFVYRGDVFRIGGGGVRAVVVEDDKWELDLSFGGALSANSEDNTVRDGMPELDFLFEVGPQLIYQIHRHKFATGGTGQLKLRLQARSVFSTDFSNIAHQGYVFEPELQWQQRGWLSPDTALGIRVSTIFANAGVQNYFYGVAEEFVTPDRSLYVAKGGYLGSDLGVSFSFKAAKNIRGFVGATLSFHQGAANDESPLFEKETTVQLGMGFVWRLGQSTEKASY